MPDLRNGQRYNATEFSYSDSTENARPCRCSPLHARAAAKGQPYCTPLHGVARTPSDSVVENAPTLSIFAGTVLSLVA